VKQLKEFSKQVQTGMFELQIEPPRPLGTPPLEGNKNHIVSGL
jgi:hypothetical protein